MSDRPSARVLRTTRRVTVGARLATAARAGLIVGLAASALVAWPGHVGATSSSPHGGVTLLTPPSTFLGNAVRVYSSEYSTATTLGSSGLLPVAQYQSELEALTPTQLSVFYTTTTREPEWRHIPALMQAIVAGAAPAVRTSAPSKLAHLARADALAGSDYVGPYEAPSCATGPSQQSIFDAQLALDVTNGVYNLASAIASATGDGLSAGAAVAAGVAAIGVGVASVLHDTLSFLQLNGNECSTASSLGYLANIDNTTSQDYALETSVAQAAAEAQTTATSNQQSLVGIQTTVASIQQTVSTALAQNQASLQSAIGGDTATILGELRADETSLQSDYTALSRLQASDALTVSHSIDSASSTIQANLSSSLAVTLQETDSTAQSLSSIVAGSTSQLNAAIRSDARTSQREFEANLQLTIEQGLASQHPELRLEMPVSVGGYLDSQPVGVQSVVEGALSAAGSLRSHLSPRIGGFAQLGERALKAHDYAAAFADFRRAYLALASE